MTKHLLKLSKMLCQSCLAAQLLHIIMKIRSWTANIRNMARAKDIRVLKKFNGCLDAALFSQAAPLQAGGTPMKMSDTPHFWETALELVRQMRAWPRIRRPRCAEVFRCGFVCLKKRKKKRKKRIQCEGCWNLALGWVEVVSFAGRGQNPEIDMSRRWRPLWIIIKHISTEKKRVESTEGGSDTQPPYLMENES